MARTASQDNTEHQHQTARRARRPASAVARWYTVEYDTNNSAWLVGDEHDRICLVPSMQLDIVQIALPRSIARTRRP